MATALAERPNAEVLPQQSGAASLLNGHYAPPPETKDGKTWVRTSVLVQAEPKALYELWRNVEGAPAWHEGTVSVRATGPNTYHWTKRGEDSNDTHEWEFEMLADEPGKRIAWRSIGGEPESEGEVLFEPASGGRGSMVTVLERIHVGTLSRLWGAMTSRDPKQSVIENLRHFKAFAETGEIPRTEPQPHGDRGVSGGIKRSLYGEKNPVPAGTLQPQEEGSSR